MSFRWVIGFSLLVLGLPNVHGQSSVLDELYGEAVHRYFAGDYSSADELLTRAIDYGSQDPRVFYYRGLARASYGGDASADFDEGARLEVGGKIGVNVGQALIRIQGPHRVQIEKARQDARLWAQQQRELARQAMPAPPPALLEQMRIDPADLPDPFEQGTRSEEADFVPTPVPPAEAPAEQDDTSVDPFDDEVTADPADPAFDSLDDPAEVDLFDSPDPFGTDDIPAEPSDSPFDDPFSN